MSMHVPARYGGIATLAAILLLGGCATNPVTGERDFVLMSEEQELALGAQYHDQLMDQQYDEYDEPELQEYVERLGQRIARESHRPDIDYTFTLVDSPQVNAFALPGGYIYITRGIMAYFNSEAELAGVLGHELGHVTARHSVRQQSAATASSFIGNILLATTDAGAGAGNLFQTVQLAAIRGYGRDQELEADRLGAEYLARTGYDDQMGARPLARIIQEHVKRPLADEVLFGRLSNGGTVRVVLEKTEEGKEKLGFEYLSREEEKASKPPKPPGSAKPRKPSPPDSGGSSGGSGGTSGGSSGGTGGGLVPRVSRKPRKSE
ncbi:MAG: M48 family metalloprotease, partial [Halofilum sp. (in: g-proteobacteria)]